MEDIQIINHKPKIVNPVQACIFDLDGVIVDTAVYHYKAWKKLANELGFDFTESDNEKLKGISRVKSLDLILQWGGAQKTEAEKLILAGRKNEWYVDMINKMTAEEILPGAKALLKALKETGIKTALGSASKNSAIILKNTGLIEYFDIIVDGNLVTASKPDPEVFLTAATLLGVSPQACVVLEDAIAGVEAARAGGMKVVGIGSEEVLKNASMVVAGLDELTIEKLLKL